MDSNEIKSPLPPRRVSVLDSESKAPPIPPIPEPISADKAPPSPSSFSTQKAKKTSPSFIYIVIALLIALVAFLVFKVLIPALNSKNAEPVTINYWGLWEDSSVLQSLISDFESKNPNIKINYKRSNKIDYRSRLAGRLAKDPALEEVPDIFRIHSSWLPMFDNAIAPVPAATATSIGLDQDFYKVFQKDLKIGNSYYAVPLMYDGLVLFYNKDLIQKGGVELPRSWWDLQTTAAKLTVRDEQGNIQVAGVAMGLTDNVDHWSDILGLLLKQNGADILIDNADNDAKIKDVISYYINFRTKYQTWDETLPPSTQLFAQGKLAFYIAPSWRVFNIEEINPSLSFDITTIPQLPTLQNITDSTANSTANLTNIHWATYWAEAVNSKSKHQAEAWKFLEFLTTKDSMEKMYSAASQIRSFGEIYPRISLASKISSNPKLKPFLDSAPTAESGYLASNTYDSGLNTELSKYFSDAINGLIQNNSDSTAVMASLKNGLAQIIQKYHLK
ncbi:extracellular solute-binding protein [Patescibacteria group bacterium]|nr:extracellular solute-binding protein [Patescibacteria group bacterium]